MKIVNICSISRLPESLYRRLAKEMQNIVKSVDDESSMSPIELLEL